MNKQTTANDIFSLRHWAVSFFKTIALPAITIVMIYAAYFASFILIPHHLKVQFPVEIVGIGYNIMQAIIVACVFWAATRLINKSQRYWFNFVQTHQHTVLSLLIPFIANSIKLITLFAFITFLFDALPLPKQYIYLTDKLMSILIIMIITWIITKIILFLLNLISIRYNIEDTDNLLAQKAQTQLILVKRAIIGIIFVIALGSILMQFSNVRELGTTLLASAGIAGILAIFPAQKFFNAFLLSFQIAIEQPIKINDYVIIDNEFGQIEEILLYNVIVKIWDLRRMVIPINYFFEKPFQNLSRKSKNILGTVFLYADYSLSIPSIRNELKKIVEESPYWDKMVCNLQVSDAKENCIELRILVSANNPSNSWDLRCEIREKLIAFIHTQQPSSLPRIRTEYFQNTYNKERNF